MKVADNLERVTQQIRKACIKANRSPEEVTIIAVTKYVTIGRAQEALDTGIVNLGENRDDGLLEKWEVLRDKPTWHFIGTLQTRKVKSIIDKVDYIHSVDRLSLAEEINKRASKKIKCFVQVNVSNEESKHGIKPEDVLPFINELSRFEHITVVGLMTMAPFSEDQELLRSCFQRLRSLRDQVQSLHLEFAPCKELSMGMSNDFVLAIQEGATMVRIGTALVGEHS
ncbi:YggS family pyridoxal phosphate-dependent enzyme [Bacillus sp. MRMR6]|uniref:YggS family pyridoxal phosphate-dependent enzyme n=1 Tax=Bacillus sp. MRMR6 TaxID=1928617 RepID=UPI00095122B1|nr:YggS family pyridoxal phosphate-dependent enzyme [Bacillus sp. MRMR6]OLS42027.1 YggS family pyridoxal phosphate enzyme [Bacillus sp. MRMR6]